jgi:hypothetical protein
LAFAGLRFRPASQQQVEFLFSPDKLGQAARVESLEAALDRCGSQSGPSSHGACYTFQFLRPKVLKLEKVAYEPAGTLSNDDTVRLRHSLQARRKVRRLAYDGLLLRRAGANKVSHDYQSRCDADAGLKGRVGLQAAHRSH